MGNGVAAISPRHQPYKEKARRDASGLLLLYYCRQRPTLPHSFPCSTIGGIRLNFRVRNGNGCDPDPMTTGIRGAWGPPESFNFEGRSQTFPEIVPSDFKERLNILQTVV